MAHSGAAEQQPVQCDQCGITWAEFRQTGLLGCPADYDHFERDLTPLIQRAHEGATHHTGKTPAKHGEAKAASEGRPTVDVARLRKELQRAVEAEDYETAAKVRDQIKAAEQGEAGQ
jgi:protein arginine kinase activator